MRRLAVCLALAASLSGCAGGAALALTAVQTQALLTNFDAVLFTQHSLTEFVFEAGRGDLDITGYSYDPPTQANGFEGTLMLTNGAFPFGTGDLTIHFTVSGDFGPVDPYDPGEDLSAHDEVTVDADATFDGLSPIGSPMSIVASLTITTLENDVDSASTDVDGTFDIDHDGYDMDLAAQNLVMLLDLAGQAVADVQGVVAGVVDIPDFAVDADVSLTGLGTSIDIVFSVASETIEHVFGL